MYVSVSVKCFTFVNALKHGVRMSESLSDTSMVNYTWLKNSAAF